MDCQGDIVRPGIVDRGYLIVINSVTVSTCLDAADVMLDENLENWVHRTDRKSVVCTQ